MPNYYSAISESSLCQEFNCTVNTRDHFPLLAAMIRLLTRTVMNFRQIKVGLLFMLRVITKKRMELQTRMNLRRID